MGRRGTVDSDADQAAAFSGMMRRPPARRLLAAAREPCRDIGVRGGQSDDQRVELAAVIANRYAGPGDLQPAVARQDEPPTQAGNTLADACAQGRALDLQLRDRHIDEVQVVQQWDEIGRRDRHSIRVH
jgi:hypothetical protein